MSEAQRFAEWIVAGAMVRYPETIPLSVERVRLEDFTIDRCRRVFAAAHALWERGVSVDEGSVLAELEKSREADAVGGLAGLMELTDAASGFGSNVEYHAGIVATAGARRRIKEAAVQIAALADGKDATPDELQAEAERLVSGAMPKAAGGGLVRARDLLPDVLTHLEDLTRKTDQPNGIQTGVRAVDEKLGGLEKGDLVLLAARPSMGKSAFGVCNLASHAALRQRKNVALFSLETNERGVMKRLIASEGRVDVGKAKRNRYFADDEYPRIAEASGSLHGAPLWIDHTPGMTVERLRVVLRKAAHQMGSVDLIVVDYLQLMTHPKAKSRYEEVSVIGASLKAVAKEFDSVVVALSQLSRAVESRPDKRPMMSDLRESGTLEQDADVIVLLYRPEYYFGPSMKVRDGSETREVNVEGKAEIIQAKVRDGQTGTAVVGFEKEFTRFVDL